MRSLFVPLAMLLAATTVATANAATAPVVGGKCARDGVKAASGPGGTGNIVTCYDGVWRAAPTSFGTVTITVSNRVQSFIVGIGGDDESWVAYTNVPYIAAVTAVPGKKPVETIASVHDGMWGNLRAVGQADGRVALKIHLENTALIKMAHSPGPDGTHLDLPDTHHVDFSGTIDIADGETTPVVTDGKTVGTVSWNALGSHAPKAAAGPV